MNLDLITYGNPTNNLVPYLEKENYLDYLFEELSKYTFPKNSSDATKEELNEIVEYLNTLSDEENKKEYLPRYNSFDLGLKNYFKKGLIKSGKEEGEVNYLVDNIIEDIKPLLFKLKFFHQRPRPYQLAEYYKLKLFPFPSHSASTPSFPSGHAFEGRILTEVIGNLYPSTYSFMQDLFEDICYSRVYLGLHYQSDIDVGIFCADKVLESMEFKKKYKL
jgi:hypothetical protein